MTVPCVLPQPDMAGRRGSAPRPGARAASRAASSPAVHALGVLAAVLLLLLATCAASSAPPGKAASSASSASSSSSSAPVTRQRRSDDYDNLDNFLMGSSDYDNFFLKTAKSVPRIGRRSGGSEDPEQAPVHVDRRSTDMNELVPSYANGYDHFFLKASKSVPRIGKRNDEFFMKTAKSVPRIGRRSGDGPDDFLLKGRDQSDFLKTSEPRPRRGEQPGQPGRQVERRSRLQQVEEHGWPSHGGLGGNDAVLAGGHRVQRRNYDELMAKAAKTVPRMGKRVQAALDEVGDWGTEQQWPWFRQPDSSPGPNKRTNPADLIDLSEVPWESMDILLRGLEGRRGREVGDDGGRLHDVVLIEEADKHQDGDGRWSYSVAAESKPAAGKEMEEPRYQPEVKKK
ncbi:hypothetical protein ONE63_004719 [Megalurothrips usitatus]|uniref:Uncharacterized protein n=1 Tax=Megalurothrips usitatus TaxID=439358 RepID=A0AAV7X4S2_9NEOP|nr:hypothetical protein ONE63_004719 [Megalurothrips usitatus]